MFWTITIIVVVAFVATVSWLGRPRGTAKDRGGAAVGHDARRAKWKAQGQVGNYDNH
ncbi:hypothetical protein GCM10009795_037960 [Nocardioides hankookensis]|uniref:Uncharacterized protein n=1 Tax=Nocardioides hankookensis TaxID=443157 RepID=A0ABW1LPZ3_9ACTN